MSKQFGYAVATAMLVLVVHSVHMHAASPSHVENAVLDASEPVQSPQPLLTVQPLLIGQFLDNARAMGACMTFEFWAPRVLMLVMAAVGFVAMLVTGLATGHNSMGRVEFENARPPPGLRRQALLGVFLS
jgi:hypothetical protein